MSAGRQCLHSWDFVTKGIKIKQSLTQSRTHTIDSIICVYSQNHSEGGSLIKADPSLKVICVLHNYIIRSSLYVYILNYNKGEKRMICFLNNYTFTSTICESLVIIPFLSVGGVAHTRFAYVLMDVKTDRRTCLNLYIPKVCVGGIKTHIFWKNTLFNAC